MHIIDIIVVAFVLFWINRGYKRGFILQFVSLISVVVSFVLAWIFSPLVAKIIRPFFRFQEIDGIFTMPIAIDISVNDIAAASVAFAITFIGARIGLMIFARTLDFLCRLPVLNTINRVLGLMVSFAEMLILIVLVVTVASFIPTAAIQDVVSSSWVSQQILAEFSFLRDKILQFR